jgi:hypothetical protein
MNVIIALIIFAGIWDDILVNYSSGLWTVKDDSSAFGDSYMETQSGIANITFEGSAITIIGTLSLDGGTANLCIDDDCVVGSWNAQGTVYQQKIITLSGLESGQHTLTITANNDGAISLDAVYISPHPNNADAWVRVENGTLFSNSMTAGDQSIFIVLVALLIISLVSITLQVWRGGSS